MTTSLSDNELATLEIWCDKQIGILEILLVLKFQILRSIIVCVISLYVIFHTFNKR